MLNVTRTMADNLKGRGPAERDCQDQMIKASVSFTNNAMQLKILCSVKAASVEKNKVPLRTRPNPLSLDLIIF